MACYSHVWRRSLFWRYALSEMLLASTGCGRKFRLGPNIPFPRPPTYGWSFPDQYWHPPATTDSHAVDPARHSAHILGTSHIPWIGNSHYQTASYADVSDIPGAVNSHAPLLVTQRHARHNPEAKTWWEFAQRHLTAFTGGEVVKRPVRDYFL
jgi:hypothetical protein